MIYQEVLQELVSILVDMSGKRVTPVMCVSDVISDQQVEELVDEINEGMRIEISPDEIVSESLMTSTVDEFAEFLASKD